MLNGDADPLRGSRETIDLASSATIEGRGPRRRAERERWMRRRRIRSRAIRSAAALLTLLSMVAAACGRGTAQQGTSSSPRPDQDLLARIQTDETIRVVTDQGSRPRSWYDAGTGTWKGFDVEVAREIAYRLGVTVEFQRRDWETDVADGSWNDLFDMAVGSMPVSDQSANLFALTPAYYYDTPSSIAVPQDDTSIEDLDSDLDGKTICVGAGTVAERYLSLSLNIPGYTFDAVIDDPRILSFPTETQALEQLTSALGNRCDAAMTSTSAIDRSLAAGGSLKVVGKPLCGVPLAIAFDRNPSVDNASLVEAVSNIVKDMHDDDTLRTLSIKWFGEDLTSVG